MRECDFGVVFPINLCKPLIRKSAFLGKRRLPVRVVVFKVTRVIHRLKLGTPRGINGDLRFPALPFFHLVTPADNVVWELVCELRMRPPGKATWCRDTVNLKNIVQGPPSLRIISLQLPGQQVALFLVPQPNPEGMAASIFPEISRVPISAGYRPTHQVDLLALLRRRSRPGEESLRNIG